MVTSAKTCLLPLTMSFMLQHSFVVISGIMKHFCLFAFCAAGINVWCVLSYCLLLACK
jgi:hypothetical protein